jgi:hypothetical protein
LSSRSLSASVLGHEQWTRATTAHGTERWTCMLVNLGCQKTGGATQCEGLRRHQRWWLGVPPHGGAHEGPCGVVMRGRIYLGRQLSTAIYQYQRLRDSH